MSTLRDMNVGAAHEAPQIDALREAMVVELREDGRIRSDRVADAFRAVPRHLFAPEAPVEKAYTAYSAVVTKRDEHGDSLSSVSAPWVQAVMLEQLQVEPGQRVLEIGSGGYNAALLAELVGEDGQVTTVDIDSDIADRARQCLAAAGYDGVNVLCADAEDGVPGHAPFDRIIVTAGALDMPPAWSEQLAEGGRLVVPLHMRGLMARAVVFEREGGHWVSRGYHLCGFVSMRGAGAHREHVIPLYGDDVGLRVEGAMPVDPDRLRDALSQPQVERWSGVEIGGMTPADDLDLWLSTAVTNFGLLTTTDAAIERCLAPRGARFGISTAVLGGTLAYRALRPVSPDRSRFEFGVYAHGPEAETLADQYVDLIRTWDRAHRHGPGPRIEAHPAATADAKLPDGRVIDKKHTRVVITWPGGVLRTQVYVPDNIEQGG